MKNLTQEKLLAVLLDVFSVVSVLDIFNKVEYNDNEAKGVTYFLNNPQNRYNLSHVNPMMSDCIGFVSDIKLSLGSVNGVIEQVTVANMAAKAVQLEPVFGTPVFSIDEMVTIFQQGGFALNAFANDGVVTMIEYLMLNKETGDMTGYSLTADSFPILGIEL